jgi:hypothetical protein
MTFALISFLAGMVLGQRFKVLILVPACALIAVVALVDGFVRTEAFWQMALMATMGLVSLQTGYFIGVGVRHILAGERPHADPTRLSTSPLHVDARYPRSKPNS